MSDLDLVARASEHGNLVALLRSLGRGVLRLGGSSADDDTQWTPAGAPRAAWARATVTPSDLVAVGRLAAATGWDVLLTVNLGHYDPSAAADEVAVARAALGLRLLGVEIGNEPEHFVLHRLRRARAWNSRVYRTQVNAYRQAIERASPGVSIAGPDAVSLAGSLGWVLHEAAWEHPALLTAHYYPLGHCGAYVPTISALLGAGVRQGESGMLALAEHVQAQTRIPLRLDETNNVACGGLPGVSDTFASALWASDFIGRAMASQVQGMNFHGLLTDPEGYGPLVFTSSLARRSGRLSANPEFYALLLTRSLIGDRALRGRLAPAGLDGGVQPFLAPGGGLDVLAVNEAPAGTAPVRLRLPLPDGFRAATIWRLTASGSSARFGVRLAGRSVPPDGTFTAAPAPLGSSARGRRLAVSLPADSAALVTLGVATASAR